MQEGYGCINIRSSRHPLCVGHHEPFRVWGLGFGVWGLGFGLVSKTPRPLYIQHVFLVRANRVLHVHDLILAHGVVNADGLI